MSDSSLTISAQYLNELVEILKRTGLYTPDVAGRLSYIAGTIDTLINPPSNISKIPIEPPFEDLITFRYEPGKRFVTLMGRPIKLTKLEDAILGYLYSRKNSYCSQREIEEAVWGHKVHQRTHTVHLSRLRKKLGDHGKLIVNDRRGNYALNLK